MKRTKGEDGEEYEGLLHLASLVRWKQTWKGPQKVAPEPPEESPGEPGGVELAGAARRYQGRGHDCARKECPDLVRE